MTKLRFDADQCRRILEHTLAAPEHRQSFGDVSAARPQFWLVKDDGIYLMSNGAPRDLDETHDGPSDKTFVAYAKGYDPRQGEVWDKCRDAVGGDDFVEFFDLDQSTIEAIRTCKAVLVHLTASQIGLSTEHETTPTAQYDQTVAREIYRQLGGQRFKVMTGAKAFFGQNDSLYFSLPAKPGYVKKGINRVRVRLTGSDDYEITFSRYTRNKGHPITTEIAKVEGIYFDQLADTFTRHTGLDTSLTSRKAG